ncbi:hypothetical protein BDV95DRAFT_385660 [Massariosphaeria phaeospora]|uniref:Cell wall anchored protein n=1 Tax=Massariosphaeria phaeospora TaxID=100035 RepID=A0A7C8MG57_9PLEO|nr:hypothetical protein BDV95DRAFT_385660 [Massariosphaeria phaeospora]
MQAMAFLHICLFAALNFAAWSLQATKDPLNDFCRRWGHQTAQVDGKLYIDGGLVAWSPLSANPLNYSNPYLVYSDLSTTQDVGMPIQHANLTKDGNVPSVAGGILWADEINKCFYLYGGEYQSNPAEFSFWAYDTVLNQWNETEYDTNDKSIQRVSYGAGTQIEELGLGFYYGGWMNNRTSPGWSGLPMAANSLIKYDFTKGVLNNNTGPDSTGRAEGQMVYLPASDGGLLVYLGGVEDPHGNGSFVGANMSSIHIFDVSSSKWYTQTAGGEVPESRRQFCAGATWADDYSTYNIYLYGGFGIENVTGFDNIYILSLPSFTWIKGWPTNNSTAQAYPHGGCSANVINKDQMLIIGGWFTTNDECDSADVWGQHNMNMGYNGPAKAIWDKYDPKISTYFVPTPVISVVGGGPTGGATIKTPTTWDNPDLSVYFTRVPTFSARAATRTTIGSALPPLIGNPSKTNVGAIAGGVVGGLVALIAILSLILFCLHRRKKDRKSKSTTSSAPPTELAGTPFPIHEMSSSPPVKYMHMQQQPEPSMHPAYSGSINSHSASHDNQSPASPYPPQVYQYNSPGAASNPYPAEYPRQNYHQPQNSYPPYSDNTVTYDSQQVPYDPHIYPPPSAATHQQQHSYPTPTSPNHPPLIPQQQPQVYYPPPPDPSTGSPSHPAYSDRLRSPEGTQHSGATQDLPPSTSTTPAHFYAQPVPIHPQHLMSGGAGLAPGGYGSESGSSPRGFGAEAGSLRGSVDSRRRPIKGRFVEVDHM